VREVPAKTILLREGEVARHMYVVKAGCLRLWFNKDGKDVTFQFLFENQPVSSKGKGVQGLAARCHRDSPAW
jgi:CRP-like cAMP-binding protein